MQAETNTESKNRKGEETMKRFCALLIAVLLLAGIPLAACAETVEEPAVILLDEPQETEDEAEKVAGEDTAPARKTDNNYNHKVLLSDDFCTVSVADASFVPDEGWTVTVKCENRAEEAMDFSWENTVLKSGEEESVWTEEITVVPGTWKQLTFSASDITEADSLRIEVFVSETEKQEEGSENQTEEAIQKDTEENPADNTEEATEEENEKYHASAEAFMKNANRRTYVLDDAASPIVVDFDALTKRNGDVCGWLYCPDTVISYPVVQARIILSISTGILTSTTVLMGHFSPKPCQQEILTMITALSMAII